MTMDHEVLDEGCKSCSALRNEIDKRNALMEHNNAQQLAGFLTLKQKIIGTDKLIREYQASKVERDILTRKNEEFVHLIDQLHRDLSTRNQDYTQLCGNAEILRKTNSEYEAKVKLLTDETEKWKSQAEAGQNFTSQLVEKVKILEKYEEEVKHTAAISRESEKTESKLQVLKGQLKDAKETATKSKKELTNLQKNYTQLVKYAKNWGKILETQGKLNIIQKRFFIKLCNKEAQETEDDVDPDSIDANEIDEQSKLLEDLLDDGNGSESMITPTGTLLNDKEMSGGNSTSNSNRRGKSPGAPIFSEQTEQSPLRAKRKSGVANGTPSKILSPNKTPPRGPTTRSRIRTASQTSISQGSDADNGLESGKENNKRSGPRTRSRSIKVTQLSGVKGPELCHSSELRSAVAQTTSPKSVGDTLSRSFVSMDTLLMTETTSVQGHSSKSDLHRSLSSAESQVEHPGPLKPIQRDQTLAETSTTATTECIAGVKPLINLFEPDVSGDTPNQRSGGAGTNMDQYVAKAQPEFETSVNSSSLFGFCSDSSSDSDVDMIPVPSRGLPITNKNHDQNILQNSSPSLPTTFIDTGDESTGDLRRKLDVGELQHNSASAGTDMQNANNVLSIFAEEANLKINSLTQDLNSSKSLQEKISDIPCPEVAVPCALSLEEELRTIIPENGDIQGSESSRDIASVSNADVVEELNKTSAMEFNCDTELLVTHEKNFGESAAKNVDIDICSEKLEPISAPVKDSTKSDVISPTIEPAGYLASGTEESETNNVPTSIFALDMDLDISSSEPDSDVAKSTAETTSDFSSVKISLQEPLTLLDEESTTVVRKSVQEPTGDNVRGAVLTVEANEELPSEVLAAETNDQSQLTDVNRENMEESPGVLMGMLLKKHEGRNTEQVDELKADEDKSTTKPSQEPTSGIGETNSDDVPRSIFGSDMDIDITSSQPSLGVVKPIEEEKSELSCEEAVLEPSPSSLDEEPSTVVAGILNVQDSLEIQELHSEVPEVENNDQSKLMVVSGENCVEHPCTETDVSSKRQKEINPLQADELTISEEKIVTQKPLQLAALATGDLDNNYAPSSGFAVDLDLDISSSELDSDVTNSTEETESKLLNDKVALQPSTHLHEEPVTVSLGSVNVQSSQSHYGCDPVLEEFRDEVQPAETTRECELLLVNDANVGESLGVKMDIPPQKEKENNFDQMKEGSPGTKIVVPWEKREETNPDKIDESTKSKDKSTKSPQDSMPKMGESGTNSACYVNVASDVNLDTIFPGPDSNMAKPTEETKSELPNTEVALRASSILDSMPDNFVPESVRVQKSHTSQSCNAVLTVGANEGFHDEVLEGGINSESKILSVCDGNTSAESPTVRKDILAIKHEEHNTERIEGLRKTEKVPGTEGLPTCPTLQTDESEGINNVHSSIFALDVDLDISSSEPESDTANSLTEKKSEFANKEVLSQATFSVEEKPVIVVTKSVDERSMQTDIASKTHGEPSSQLVCTSTKSVEKSLTEIWQRYPASGSGESDINSVRYSISALNADLDISSSEPDSDETKLVEESKAELSNSEVNVQMPYSFDEEPSPVVPEKVIVQSSKGLDSCGAISKVGADRELANEVPMLEDTRENGEMSGEVIASALSKDVQVLHVGESLSNKATVGKFCNEAQTMSEVMQQKLTLFHATPARQTTVLSSPANLSNLVIPGQSLPSNHLGNSEEKLGVDSPIQQGTTRPTGAQSPCRFPTANAKDGNQTKRDGRLPPVHRPSSAQESFVSPSVSNKLPETATFPQSTQILEPVRTSAFKVPRVPDAPPRVSDVYSSDLTQNYPWSRGSTQGVKRTAADDEVAVILKQIRTNIIEIPATVSPLPRSPDPPPVVSVKIEEPKSRFPILPRCAFNWTGKKLPLSDKLTERFGAYLHPGVQARVRFRRVSRRLQELRTPDILSNCYQGVTNFAEAERRPEPIVKSVQLVGDIADLNEWENNASEPTQKRGMSIQKPNDLPETRSSSTSSSEQVEEVTLSAQNLTSSTKRKRKRKTLVNRSKTATPALFGSSSSESECESAVVSQPIKERVTKSSTTRCLNENKLAPGPSTKSMQTVSHVSTSRAQAMAQLIEPIVPLGRANRSDFTPIKPTEVRREAESIFNPSRAGLGLGRAAKVSQHTIAPCSDALLSATLKSKTMNRVIASAKRIAKEPQVSSEPVKANLIVSDSFPVQDKSPVRKRVSHLLKRGLDSDPVVSAVPPASKRGRSLFEVIPTASSQTAQLDVPAETLLDEASIKVRKGPKRGSTLPIKPQEMVKLGAQHQSSSGSEKSQLDSVLPKNVCYTEASMLEDATIQCDTEQQTVVVKEVTPTIPSVTEKNILDESARSRHQLLENSERSAVDKSPCLPDIEESPQSPDTEVYPQSPGVEESLQPHDLEESPRSPDPEVSQKIVDVEGTPKTRMDQQSEAFDNNARSTSTVLEIPLVSSGEIEEHQPTVFELVLKELLQKSPPINQKVSKLKRDINLYVNRVFKNPDVTEESWNGLIERAMRFDSKNSPCILIRKLIASVIKGWDNPMDLSKTPPAPPMAPVHQRCVMVLKELDEANSKLTVEPSHNLNMYSNLFLSEISAVMFQQDSSLTLEEMSSLARVYMAVCRSCASLARARTFLFDCVFFMPPRSYALTYTIVSVWADVLRHISFPLGPSCIDQTIAYLLLHNCKVKAVPGIAGKVLQARSFLQNTYGYKNVTTTTIDDLVNYLMTRFKETNSADEASSLSWSLALLARWEGIDFAIDVIEKQLWPFLQRWSSGEGTNSGAAAVIVAIGMLGKTVPSSKRAGVKRVLSTMKVLLQSDEVIPSIHEAAIEAVVLLGEDEDPKSVIEVLKAWKLVNTKLSQHLRQVLKAFLKRHSSLVLPSH